MTSRRKCRERWLPATKQAEDFLPILDSIFKIARFFGITSYGITIAFSWSFILFLMLVIVEACAIWKLVQVLTGRSLFKFSGGMVSARLSGVIFYANALISLILSSKFVHDWQNLSSSWSHTENAGGLNLPSDVKVKRRVIFVSSLVASCAFIEHMLSMMSAADFNIPPEEYLKKYILSSHSFVLGPHDYNIWIGVPLFLLSKLATALWNFQDLIIILISIGLTSRYHKLNLCVYEAVKTEKLYRYTKKLGTNYVQPRIHTWRQLREAFVRQAKLVRMVDSKLGPLVMLSNINNFYFICIQFLLGSQGNGSAISHGYHLLSLGWLIIRACSVVLAAADVHLHSKRALSFLSTYPSVAYNVEIKRLQYQLTHDFVALSGMGFFSLTRVLLLEVVSAIVKYELVLIQYDT